MDSARRAGPEVLNDTQGVEPPVTTEPFRSPTVSSTAPLPGGLGVASKVVWAILYGVGAVGLIALFVTIVAEVFGRYLLGAGIAGGNDMVSRWWMVMLVFAGIAIAQNSDGRIQVDFLLDALPPGLRRIADTVVLSFVALVGLALAWFGLQEALHQMSLGEFAPIGNRPIWPFRFLVPIGFTAFSFACVLSIVHIWRVGYPEHDTLPSDPTRLEEEDAR